MSAAEPSLRLFVALAVPPEVKARLAAAQQELRAQWPARAASWTRPEQVHLTLRFLGDVATSKVDPLTAHLAAATAGFGPLQLVAEGAGCFPDTRSPRVIWIGVGDAGQRLTELHQRIVAATEDFTRQPVEKDFTGHVTLGRTRHLHRRHAEALANFVAGAVDRRFGEWTADQIELMRSELLPGGSRYSCLAALPLGSPG